MTFCGRYCFRALALLVGLYGFFALGCGGANVEDTQSDKTSKVSIPPTGENKHYLSNIEPLTPNPLVKLPVHAVLPKGWLLHQMVLMKDGMVGHIQDLSHFCVEKDNAWANAKGEGTTGWEELPYWLRGYGDLGYLLEDEAIIKETKKWIEFVLASQEEDGYFGPKKNKARFRLPQGGIAPDLWANMVMLDILRSYYEYSEDSRALECMKRYARWELDLPREAMLPGSWQKVRGGDNLENVYWLYNRLKEPWLLELGKALHENTADWTTGIASWHGVNIAQGFREPAIYYQQSRNTSDLDATERNYQLVTSTLGQFPGGMYGADENARPDFVDPRQGTETCAMVEFMRSCESLLAITGKPIHADRCEDVAFNSFPASVAPDFMSLHYLTSANLVQIDKENKSPGFQNVGCMLAFSPGEAYRCCQHNVSQGWPYFTEHLWMATGGNGLAAVLYAPCEVKAKVGTGETITITETTDYPFGETVDLQIGLVSPDRFPLYFRIPGWCAKASISINDVTDETPLDAGTFFCVERLWQQGDKIRLTFPMDITLKIWEKNKGAASIYRGPLAYSLKIGQDWREIVREGRWSVAEVYATTPWNYGLVLSSTAETLNPPGISVVRKEGALADQPFKLDNAPITLVAKGRKIPGWQLEKDGLVGRLQRGPILTEEPEEEISLIPMGCAHLRITAFPIAGQGSEAHAWRVLPAQLSGSFDEGFLAALTDGTAPTDSNDTRLPPYVWAAPLGGSVWAGQGFDEPRSISKFSVYWFDDKGESNYRVPASWKLMYKDGLVWQEVSNATGYGLALDKFNDVSFDPIVTDEIRLEAQLQPGMGGGILEWAVK